MNENYPKSLLEFESCFGTEKACRDYLAELRWPNGFVCPRCAFAEKAWRTQKDLFHCPNCGAQTSVTAGTIFHQTRKPLQIWFRAMWHVTSQKYGANALGFQRTLDFGSYNTAWQWLHKLRRAMVRPGRDRLAGIIEVDEAYVGGAKPGKRGRGSAGKALVGVAVEDKGDEGIGRIRLQHLEDASGDSLIPFVQNIAQPGSVIRTDEWLGYNDLKKKKFEHVINNSHDFSSVKSL